MRDFYLTDIARFNLTNFCSGFRDKSRDDCRFYRNKEGVEFSSSTHRVVDGVIKSKKYGIDCGDLNE
ncbi:MULTISPECIES: hypothetical protein [unclassified Campylobacter]|uniref:hypothetical protein n=1 Tax=unclassified Campylobacter TaxID=2593542 RepID=UPI001D595200|nr:hypothetical protein [Campylobacter sp. RM9331]MBZ8005168.1 hypothetical protein [Campylobacter sp. RM9332]